MGGHGWVWVLVAAAPCVGGWPCVHVCVCLCVLLLLLPFVGVQLQYRLVNICLPCTLGSLARCNLLSEWDIHMFLAQV